jgi:hypothetical protein
MFADRRIASDRKSSTGAAWLAPVSFCGLQNFCGGAGQKKIARL